MFILVYGGLKHTVPRCANPGAILITRQCKRRTSGSLIAVTALVHGMVIVTRNVSDYDKAGVEPWNEGS